MLNEKEILELIDEAIIARESAYAKFSNFKVGAVLIDDRANHYSGCNVENSSYGLSMCGERNAIFHAVSKGMKKIKVIAIVGDTEGPLSPCGACRQVINEFSTEDTIVIMANMKKEYKVVKFIDLFPYGFRL
ncbi:MAG: cytidine deaminase [Psychrilyobacter sp.]|uniref:cytidine deaminase n=1 Tax=Psychrilyobacter sp. TaxID=2586924 RepID=UPI003C754982